MYVCVYVCVACVIVCALETVGKDVHNNSFRNTNEPPFIDFNEILIAILIHSPTFMKS